MPWVQAPKKKKTTAPGAQSQKKRKGDGEAKQKWQALIMLFDTVGMAPRCTEICRVLGVESVGDLDYVDQGMLNNQEAKRTITPVETKKMMQILEQRHPPRTEPSSAGFVTRTGLSTSKGQSKCRIEAPGKCSRVMFVPPTCFCVQEMCGG